MIAILAKEEVGSCFSKLGEIPIFEEYGVLSEKELKLCIKKIRSTDEINLLIIDVEILIENERDTFLQVIKNYRFVRIETRIIVLLPNNVSSTFIEELVSLGIYDFVRKEA